MTEKEIQENLKVLLEDQPISTLSEQDVENMFLQSQEDSSSSKDIALSK